MRAVLLAVLLTLSAYAAIGCHRYIPLTPAQAKQLQENEAAAKAPYVRRKLLVDSNSEQLPGQFEGVFIGQREPQIRYRLQLFPDLGPKVLDMAIDAQHLIVTNSPKEPAYQQVFGENAPTIKRPLTLFAVSLYRHFGGLRQGDVIGSRSIEGGYILRLKPHASGIESYAEVDPALRLKKWRFNYRGFSWELDVGPPVRLIADDTAIELRFSEEEGLDKLPDHLFDLSASGEPK